MTGDPLDRIAQRAQYPRLRLTLRCDEVLALVEVARAARLRNTVHDRECQYVMSEGEYECECGHMALAGALSRMDKEAE